MATTGLYKGRHYSEYVGEIEELKRSGDLRTTEELLLKLIPIVEKEAKDNNWELAPWYYEQLAIIYRKENRYVDEIEILTRYSKLVKTVNSKGERLIARIEKAKELQSKNISDK
jgi:hypothetical protein